MTLQQTILDDKLKDRINKLAYRFWSIHPKEFQDMNVYREEFYANEITKLCEEIIQNERKDKQ